MSKRTPTLIEWTKEANRRMADLDRWILKGNRLGFDAGGWLRETGKTYRRKAEKQRGEAEQLRAIGMGLKKAINANTTGETETE